MANVTLRLVKGSPLTNAEVDNNFSNLNIFKVEIGGDLSGNVFTPVVSGIQQRSVANIAPANNQALIWVSGNNAWEPGNVATQGGLTTQYIGNLIAGTGVSITGLTGGANAVPTVAIGQDVSTTANVTFNSLTILGNLLVNGNVTTLNSNSLTINDPLIYLAGNNYSSDTVDIGFVGNYYDGVVQRHAGLFRDASDGGNFKLFANLNPEPTNIIDTANATFRYANLIVNTVTGNLIGTAANATTVDWFGVTSKPSPSINVTLTGDVVGSANVFLNSLGSNTLSISTVIQPNSVALGTDTTGNYTDRVIAGTGTTVSGTADEGNVITVGLTNTGVSATTYGNATIVPVITVDAQGRITSASNVTISLPAAGASNAFTTINVSASGNVIASSATSSVFFANSNVSITANVQNNTITFDLVDTNVTPGVYGNTTLVPQITVDSKGRITSLSNIAVTTGTLSTQYIGNLVAGTGVSITGLTGAPNAIPTISIGQSVATTANVTFNSLIVSANANIIGNITLNSLADIKTYMEVEAAPTISAGTLTLDLSTATIFDVSLNGSITTLTINNTPSTASRAVSFVLILTADGTPRTVAWPGSFRWPSATAPTITSTLNKRDIFTFMSTDNGTSWNAFITGQNL